MNSYVDSLVKISENAVRANGSVRFGRKAARKAASQD